MKNQKITKGTSSAVLLSILIHATLFLLAGTLVVFTVVKKKEIEFEPPKVVERPKMKLKKPKVKVKKTSRPKPTTRIVTKVDRASMPDIQLPEMSGMSGEGVGDVVGGFDTMPDLGEVTIFGGGQSIGNDFVGTFYDFKHDRNGRNLPYSREKYQQELRKFLQKGWNPSQFGRYYRSPKKLYATCFMVPSIFSVLAPEAFGEPEIGGWCWAVHYKGQLVHKDAIKFRFWGSGDDVLVVRVDGKIVLNGSWAGLDRILVPMWQSSSPDSNTYWLGNRKAIVGDWITLEPGVPLDMEVLIGEEPGGIFSAMLLVEVEGVEYERGPQQNPVLPMFKTAVPSLDLVETIHENLIPGEACVTNGPVFCDYDMSGATVSRELAEPVAPEPEVGFGVEKEMRLWTLDGGVTEEAVFEVVIGRQAVLRDRQGRQRRIPLDRFCKEDLTYIELARPPKFAIDFSKKSSQRIIKESPYVPELTPKHLDYVFSARLVQTSAGEYNHELKVEFFAIGEEIAGDNYILFDHQESRFTPTKENGRSHEFKGDTIPLRETTLYSHRSGAKYGGYLVVVTDVNGRIIDHGSSHKWLLGILDNLRTLPLGKHFDKTGRRVEPPRPTTTLH